MALAAFKKFTTRLDSHSTTPGPPNSELSQDEHQSSRIEPDVSSIHEFNQAQRTGVPFNLCLKSYEQTWDYEKDEWTDVLRVPRIPNLAPFTKIIAYNRKDGKRSYRDHIWIEFRNKATSDLLKPYFRGLSGFSGLKPGVDARHVYTRRKALMELMVHHSDSGDASRGERSYTELRHLLEYINEAFADVTAFLESMGEESDPQIPWSLLWALFVKDGLVETKDFTSRQGMAFKLNSWVYEEPERSEPRFVVYGQMLQWTGVRYANVSVERAVERYAGMQPFSRLQIKPLTPSRQEEFADRGKKYIKLAGVHHLDYRTNIMWSETDARGCPVVVRERADGRVMIDVSSFRRFNPNRDPWDSDDLSEDCPKQNSWRLSLDDNDHELCLLPPSLHGWSFAAKKWGELLVDKISSIPFQANVFEHLVLPEDDKKIIQSLVEAQAGARGITLFKDVVSGKGSGLVLLLHGNPGTGKTLTAEAVSEHLRLPLYSVSCSEFGTSLEQVEEKLKHILDITSLWKAIVLIDEADIFLEARSDCNTARNALVGVFLRMLEYHSGIVILTTNRVRTLDEAFRSRLSLALKYKDLDCNSRGMLWRKFLSLAGATIQHPELSGAIFDFSIEDIAELSRREINGRVIKHVVRTSQALALSDGEQLNAGHIARVWKILDAFEEDLQPISWG